MYCRLPKSTEAQVLGKQALRSGTSVAANYRDETLLWLELFIESGIVSEAKMAGLHQEADELLRMTIAAIKTARKRKL